MKTKNKVKTKEKMSRKKVLLIIVCIFLAILMVLGATLAIIVGVKNANSVVYIDDVRLGEGECNYLAAYYKYIFLTAYASEGAADTPEFWNSVSKNGKTYGERLADGAVRYIKDIAIKNYLFNSYCKFDKADDVEVKKAVKEILDHKADDSVEKFNELAAPSGFNFADFENASLLLYKASALEERIFGTDGEKIESFLTSSSMSTEIKEYLDKQYESYSHVKLLFIRTEDTFKVDDNGNRVRDENGEDILVPLSDLGKTQRIELLSDIRGAISAYNTGSGEGEMTPVYFNALLAEHGADGDMRMNDEGYYFSSAAEFTTEFASGGDDLKRIVDMSLAMSVDSYAEVAFDGGICFIYKYKNTPDAYLTTEAYGCLSDFYKLAVSPVLTSVTESYMDEVTVKDSLLATDFKALAYNYLFIPSF
ncbi:MAG: hypothetical protein IKV16_01240 [Clostridia bacterium]|nr:hypothetical protein [Clostridia bacterium]